MTSPEVSVAKVERCPAIDVQWAVDADVIAEEPSLAVLSQNDDMLTEWSTACAEVLGLGSFEVAIRVVEPAEIIELNSRYRAKPVATNVLSFPNGVVDESGLLLLGDMVICATVVVNEARAQGKTVTSHFAHMLIHGLLHLQGLDHHTDEQAEQMEAIEIEVMNGLGFDNPYLDKPHDASNTDQSGNKIETTSL